MVGFEVLNSYSTPGPTLLFNNSTLPSTLRQQYGVQFNPPVSTIETWNTLFSDANYQVSSHIE